MDTLEQSNAVSTETQQTNAVATDTERSNTISTETEQSNTVSTETEQSNTVPIETDPLAENVGSNRSACSSDVQGEDLDFHIQDLSDDSSSSTSDCDESQLVFLKL